MSVILLSLLFTLHLAFANPAPSTPPAPDVQPCQLWWGMIDPELSAWFARIPGEDGSDTQPVLWNWSWRSFWAALTNQPITKEAADAPHL